MEGLISQFYGMLVFYGNLEVFFFAFDFPSDFIILFFPLFQCFDFPSGFIILFFPLKSP